MWSKVVFGDGVFVLVVDVMLFGEFWVDIVLYVGFFDMFYDFFLFCVE